MNTARFRDICWAVNGLLKLFAMVCGVLFLIGAIDTLFFHHPKVTHTSGPTWYISLSLIAEKVTTKQEIAANSYLFLLALPLFSYLFWYASRIFADISAGLTPFSATQLKRFRRIAFLVLILSLIQPVAYGLLLSLLSGTFSLTISLGPLFLIGILLYCFSGIIHYGVALQEFSDEVI